MEQAIAGVISTDTDEVVVRVAWPSIAVFGVGRWLGRLYNVRWPEVYFFRLGNLWALLSIPVALVLYFCRLAPRIGRRYTLTNRRIIIQTAITAVELSAVALDDFDSVEIETLPGQSWFHAGDLAFCRQGREVFRLGSVPRPEPFRQTCLKAHRAYVSVRQVVAEQEKSRSA